MCQFNAKYVSELLFQKFWMLSDLGNPSPEEQFSPEELELILLYNKHPSDRKDAYLIKVEEAVAEVYALRSSV